MSWSDQADFAFSEPTTRRPDDRAALPELLRTPAPEDFVAATPTASPAAQPAEPASPVEAQMPAAPAASTAPAPSQPARRTVVIKGHGHGHYTPSRGGYEARLRPHERSGFKPDRVALWAVLLGLALLLGAVTSSHAAILHPVLLQHLWHHAGTP